MQLIDVVKDRLDLFENLYDHVRIIDPVNKKNINISEGTCYDFWDKNKCCEDCICMTAFNDNDSLVKVKYTLDKFFLVTVSPVIYMGRKYIVEMLKELSIDSKNINTHQLRDLDILIKFLKDTVNRDELTEIYNRRYINERLPKDIKKI